MKIIACRIWMIAVIMNTIGGTALLTRFFSESSDISLLVFWGFAFGTIVSLPFFLILIFIMNRSFSKNDHGKIIFRKTLTAGILLATAASLLFFLLLGGLGESNIALFFCAIISAIIGIYSQRKYLLRMGEPIEFESF